MNNPPIHPQWKGECVYCVNTMKHLYITDALYNYLNTLILLQATEGRYTQLPESWTRPVCWQHIITNTTGILITVKYLGEEDKPDTHRDWKINISY